MVDIFHLRLNSRHPCVLRFKTSMKNYLLIKGIMTIKVHNFIFFYLIWFTHNASILSNEQYIFFNNGKSDIGSKILCSSVTLLVSG